MMPGWTRHAYGWEPIIPAVLPTSCATADLASEERRQELKLVPSDVRLKEVTRRVLQNIDEHAVLATYETSKVSQGSPQAPLLPPSDMMVMFGMSS